MFIVLTGHEFFSAEKNEWSKYGEKTEIRFNTDHIVRYMEDGHGTKLFCTEVKGGSSVFRVKETVQVIDALILSNNSSAAKVLFAKKE